jgi:hypothetical protein
VLFEADTLSSIKNFKIFIMPASITLLEKTLILNLKACNPKQKGRFLCEWIDQSIGTIRNNRTRITANDGEFPLDGPVDEYLSDSNFCVKGVVDTYHNVTPMALEVKKAYQHILTQRTEINTINKLQIQLLDKV